MSDLLPRPEFSKSGQPETATLRGHVVPVKAGRVLTTLGYAVAADLGLLFASLLISRFGLRWETVRKPKSDVSYNMPVLARFKPPIYVDPVRLSATIALGVLNGSQPSSAWADAYRRWAADAQPSARS